MTRLTGDGACAGRGVPPQVDQGAVDEAGRPGEVLAARLERGGLVIVGDGALDLRRGDRGPRRLIRGALDPVAPADPAMVATGGQVGCVDDGPAHRDSLEGAGGQELVLADDGGVLGGVDELVDAARAAVAGEGGGGRGCAHEPVGAGGRDRHASCFDQGPRDRVRWDANGDRKEARRDGRRNRGSPGKHDRERSRGEALEQCQRGG